MMSAKRAPKRAPMRAVKSKVHCHTRGWHWEVTGACATAGNVAAEGEGADEAATEKPAAAAMQLEEAQGTLFML